MTEFKHERNSTKILLYKMANNRCEAAFLTSQKPKVGDLFRTFEAGDTNFLYTFRITGIAKQEDAKAKAIKTIVKTEKGHKYQISQDKSAPFRENALMTLELDILNKRLPNGIISNELPEGTVVDNF